LATPALFRLDFITIPKSSLEKYPLLSASLPSPVCRPIRLTSGCARAIIITMRVYDPARMVVH